MAELRAQALYDQGKITEAFAVATMELAAATETESIEDQRECHATLAWCCYRLKKYDDALVHVTAGDCRRARECHCHVLAYSKGHRNDTLLLDLVTGVDTVAASNSLMVRAKDKDCNVTHKQAWGLAAGFAKTADPSKRDAVMGHLLHNGGRFFFTKFRDEKDLYFALSLLQASLEHYGTVANWHHRAGRPCSGYRWSWKSSG